MPINTMPDTYRVSIPSCYADENPGTPFNTTLDHDEFSMHLAALTLKLTALLSNTEGKIDPEANRTTVTTLMADTSTKCSTTRTTRLSTSAMAIAGSKQPQNVATHDHDYPQDQQLPHVHRRHRQHNQPCHREHWHQIAQPIHE